MTLPKKQVPAENPTSRLPALEVWQDDDRGPANAVIARLAQAIAEQNAVNKTEPDEAAAHRLPRWQSYLGLALGSATLWVVVILVVWALL